MPHNLESILFIEINYKIIHLCALLLKYGLLFNFLYCLYITFIYITHTYIMNFYIIVLEVNCTKNNALVMYSRENTVKR